MVLCGKIGCLIFKRVINIQAVKTTFLSISYFYIGKEILTRGRQELGAASLPASN